MVVHLQAQPAKVLSLLVSRAGQMISREELHGAIWGDETFVDFERGLNVCIAQVRSALGDESSSPRFVRTVPRRGYQFIYPVEPIAGAPLVEAEERNERQQFPWRIFSAALAAVALVAILIAVSVTWRRTSAPIVAVVPFDNETGDTSVNKFCKGLTDDFVEQFTAAGQNRYRVIGNASALRAPREQRNLVQIAASLHAEFIVLGQVQGSGSQTRILAHLIHMPEQTHVWVVRLEQPFDDPFTLQSTAAREIAAEFSVKLTDLSQRADLHVASIH